MPTRLLIGFSLLVATTSAFANSYPRGCLGFPLPATPTGPVVTATARLADVDGNGAGFNGAAGHFEDVAVTVWRHACSPHDSAVLLRFERPAARRGTFPVADVPGVELVTEGRTLQARIVAEPNTRTLASIGDSLPDTSVHVLDEIPGLAFDADAAMTLRLLTIANGALSATPLALAAYDSATHPDGLAALVLNGAATGSWYDPARGGEGLVLELGEAADGSRFLGFAWYTYDEQGAPSWIVGNAPLAANARSATVPALYLRGGRFAGAFDPAALAITPWGEVRFELASCDRLRIRYASAHAIAGAPTGSGERTWVRLVSIEGRPCR